MIRSLTSAEASDKSCWWLRKDSCVSHGVRKPGNTCVSPNRHDMTLAVNVTLNLNTTNNQPKMRQDN